MKAGEDPKTEETEYQRFEALTRRLLSVPVEAVKEKLAQEKAERRAKKKHSGA
jgi:hypothetical protein